jgi:F-type H+-transporting ATPase subunit gamma
MSDTLGSLRGKIDGADKLKSVVRTMKAMAASSIGQYETAVQALGDYERTVTLGLTACFRPARALAAPRLPRRGPTLVGAIVFGSDQGLVGQFNDAMGYFVEETLCKLPGKKKLWVVGERLHARLADTGLPLSGLYGVPNSVTAITSLVGRLQIDSELGCGIGSATGTETHQTSGEPENACQNVYDDAHIYVFHHQPQSGAVYKPVCQRLLPLDTQWQQTLAETPWPTSSMPEALGNGTKLLRALIREYLFISLFKACAESLASENASRLAAMQRAEKNIEALSVELSRNFYRLRQNAIDEELFDVIAGFNSLAAGRR